MLSFNDDIKNCLKILKKGGLILYPTDTIWGIGCDATNKASVEKIFLLKKRHEEKAMIILVAGQKDIFNYVNNITNSYQEKILNFLSSVKKPTTVVYNNAKNIAENLIGSQGTAAIRIVKDPFCNALITQFKKPIVSTSANISGEPSPVNFIDIDAAIKNGVDYIVQHRQSDTMSSQPSSIIKLNKDGEIEILRN